MQQGWIQDPKKWAPTPKGAANLLFSQLFLNWTQFKDPVSHMSLACAVVASWSPGWVVGSSPFTAMTNSFVTEFAEFNENILGKLK